MFGDYSITHKTSFVNSKLSFFNIFFLNYDFVKIYGKSPLFNIDTHVEVKTSI